MSPNRFFDLNQIPLRNLPVEELRHARWLYRKELRRMWWLAVSLSILNAISGVLLVGGLMLISWAALTAGTALGGAALGFLALLTAFYGCVAALRRTPVEGYLEELTRAKKEAWALAHSRRRTLRFIRERLAELRRGNT